MRTAKTAILVALSMCAVIGYGRHVSRASEASADETALRAADDAFERAYRAGDLDAVIALYAENAILLPEGAPAIKGREAIRAYYRSAMAAEKRAGVAATAALSDRAVGVSGELGWSSGENRVTGPGGTPIWSGHYLSVSRKVNGKWLYLRDIWTSDTQSTHE